MNVDKVIKIKEYNHNYYLKHKKEKSIKDKVRYYKNRKKSVLRVKEYYWKHREDRLKIMKQYREKHKEYFKSYRLINKKKHCEYIIKYSKTRKKFDANYKILLNLRCRIWYVLNGKTKAAYTLNLLGCSLDQLKQHLESHFKPGMSWSNYGKGINGKGMREWHVDHKIPCVKFDLSKPEEQRKCFHYTNLQPLWARENWSKSGK